MKKQSILWIDDEIDLLKPYILFLEGKNYQVKTANNGSDALNILHSDDIDIVFLDEQMPGLSGIETLDEIKKLRPNLPVVMITKSEEEDIMEDAIGSQITDYLIKPVSPNQILLSLKKNLKAKDIIGEKTIRNYMEEFRQISMNLSAKMSFSEWKDTYRQLVFWELELYEGGHTDYLEILEQQKEEVNRLFSKFIETNYLALIRGEYKEKITMSHNILHQKLFPLLHDERPTFFLVLDNLRYDHWKSLQPVLNQYLNIVNDDVYLGILPSVTQYARNALFAGLMPSEIEKLHPDLWVNETEDEQKNRFEPDLLAEYLRRYGLNTKFSFHKIFNNTAGNKLVDNLNELMNNKLNVIVYNSIDILSHASTDVQILRDMAFTDQSYRTLVNSWFEHSALFEMLKALSEKDVNIVVTTDHGSVRVTDSVRVKGDKETSANLRYKTGRNLNVETGSAFEIKHPADAFLPKLTYTSSFMFCKNNDYFVYPTNQQHYTGFYKNTLQHGGISMEELIIPFAILRPKN